MRKLVLLFVVAGAMLALTAGLAMAVTKNGGSGDDTLRGTNKADTLRGESGDDTLYGYARADLLEGGSGEDDIFAGSGRDDVYAGSSADYINDGDDGDRDFIDCGSGFDTVRADFVDTLRDCEDVIRR